MTKQRTSHRRKSSGMSHNSGASIDQHEHANDDTSTTHANSHELEESQFDYVGSTSRMLEESAPKTWEDFIRASHHLFQQIQTWQIDNDIMNNHVGGLTLEQRDELTNFAQDYIQLVGLFKEQRQSPEKKASDEEKAEALIKRLPVLALCVLLYIEYPDGNVPLGRLAEWMDIQLGFNDDHIDDPGDEQLTWPRLHQQLRRGNTLDVAERLKWFMTTDQCKTLDAYSSLIEVLEMIPALPMTMEEAAQWNEQWPEWHDKALVTFEFFYGDQGKLRDAHDLDDIGLRESFEVLSEPHYAGDFNLVDSYLPSLIYSRPTVLDLDTRRRCVEALQECCKTGGNDNDDDDAVYAALFSSRLDNFMGLIDRDAWLATHLGHLLLLAGHLEYDTHKDTEPSLTERPVDPIFHTFNDYARQLATEYGMLKEAMQYNMVCTVNSNCWNMELLEDHSRVSWSDHAMKSIAQFCRENKQNLVESYIYTQLGNRALDQDKHDVAAKHYATAKNIEGLENVAEILLTQYLMDGQLDHVVMADKQADALEAAPTYRFLRVYKQFRDLVQSKQFDQAYALIGPLATMEHAMADFSGVVLVDAFDVYADCKVYTRPDTLKLLDRVDALAKDAGASAALPAYFKLHHGKTLASNQIVEKLRQRFVLFLQLNSLI